MNPTARLTMVISLWPCVSPRNPWLNQLRVFTLFSQGARGRIDQHRPSEGDGFVRAETIHEAVALVGHPEVNVYRIEAISNKGASGTNRQHQEPSAQERSTGTTIGTGRKIKGGPARLPRYRHM